MTPVACPCAANSSPWAASLATARAVAWGGRSLASALPARVWISWCAPAA
jgi:hypothetical protein